MQVIISPSNSIYYIYQTFGKYVAMQNKELFDKRLLKLGVKVPYNIYDEQNNLIMGVGVAIDKLETLHYLANKSLYFVPDKHINNHCHSYDLIQDTYKSLNYLLKNYQDPSFNDILSNICNKIRQAIHLNKEGCVAYVMLDSFPTNINYAVVHCIHTAIIVHLLTNHLDSNEHLLNAALLMNISIIDLQNQLVNVASLSPIQKDKIQTHELDSVSILKSISFSDEQTLNLIMNHHNVLNDEIEVQVLRLSDVFCAKLSSRAYRKGLTGDKGIKFLFSEFDSTLVNQLIKEIDLIPCGTIVKLASQEVGIVLRKGTKPTYPKVQILLTSNGNYQDNVVIRDTIHQEYQIKKILSVEDIKVTINKKKYWQK